MQIVLTAAHKGGEHTLDHDLNFQSERYEAKHTIVSRQTHKDNSGWVVWLTQRRLQTFKNPKPDLVALLAESGPTGQENGVQGRRDETQKKKKSKDKNVSLSLRTMRRTESR